MMLKIGGIDGAGDCVVSGYDPPVLTTVLQSSSLTDNGKALLIAPETFQLLWRDETQWPQNALHIWYPVAPEGYSTSPSAAAKF